MFTMKLIEKTDDESQTAKVLMGILQCLYDCFTALSLLKILVQNPIGKEA